MNGINPYNEFFYSLSRLIPIKKTRRKLRNHIRYKIDHPRVAHYLNENYIKPFLAGEIPKYKFQVKQNFENQKIIWQLWFQGQTNASNLIQHCFKSVKKHMGDEYKIIILDETTIKDYMDFPPFVWDKLKNQTFGDKSITFFSDLLRVSLLSVYGGIWIDANIFLSDKIPANLCEKDFFAFERAKVKPNKQELSKLEKSGYFSYGYFNWNEDFKVKMLNSFLIAKQSNPFVSALKELLMHYWQSENSTQHHYYFIFQILFELLKENGYKNEEFSKSDIECHLLQFYAKEPFNLDLWEEIKGKIFIHKLTHFRTIQKNSMVEKVVLGD